MPNDSNSRLVDLELLVMHLQHDLEKLNAALVDQQQQLNTLRTLLTNVGSRLESLTPTEKFDPALERPPHY